MSLACHRRKKAGCGEDCEWETGKGCVVKRKEEYTKRGSRLSSDAKKFCRCVLHVLDSKNPPSNPYAVCASKGRNGKKRGVGTSTGGKSCDYDWSKIPDSEVRAYAMFSKQKLGTSEKEIGMRSPRELREWLVKVYDMKEKFGREEVISWFMSQVKGVKLSKGAEEWLMRVCSPEVVEKLRRSKAKTVSMNTEMDMGSYLTSTARKENIPLERLIIEEIGDVYNSREGSFHKLVTEELICKALDASLREALEEAGIDTNYDPHRGR